jgi:hypothetical protein
LSDFTAGLRKVGLVIVMSSRRDCPCDRILFVRDLRGTVAGGVQTADDRAHTRSSNDVDADAGVSDHFQHADVRRRTRKPPAPGISSTTRRTGIVLARGGNFSRFPLRRCYSAVTCKPPLSRTKQTGTLCSACSPGLEWNSLICRTQASPCGSVAKNRWHRRRPARVG